MIDPHFQQVFSMALGIREPWFIKSLEMVPSSKDPKRLEMRIEIDFTEGTEFLYGDSGDCYPVHDTRERTWRHLNFFQYRCYITARVPRVKLPDGKVRTVDVPWGRDGSGFTLMMEGVILSLVRHMAVSTAAREVGEHDTKIWRVSEYFRGAKGPDDFCTVKSILESERKHGLNHLNILKDLFSGKAISLSFSI